MPESLTPLTDAKFGRMNFSPAVIHAREQEIKLNAALAENEELRKDKERLDKIFNNGWQVSYISTNEVWIVQQQFQTIGNIGKGRTLRQAIESAIQSTNKPSTPESK